MSIDQPEGHFVAYDDPELFYDPFYPDNGFKDEVDRIKTIVEVCKKSVGKRLLDVACGTGRHLSYLRYDFQCTGLDLNNSMLKVAAQRLPGVSLILGDLRTFDLGESFDVITCLGGGIAYAQTDEELDTTMSNLYRHTTLGGIVVVDPWNTIESFVDGEEKMKTWDGREEHDPRLQNLKVARANVVHLENAFSVTEYHYLVATRGGSVKHIAETHRLRLFTRQAIAGSLTRAGFTPIRLSSGLGPSRELFLGLR